MIKAYRDGLTPPPGSGLPSISASWPWWAGHEMSSPVFPAPPSWAGADPAKPVIVDVKPAGSTSPRNSPQPYHPRTKSSSPCSGFARIDEIAAGSR
jgi:hypothetical protein